MSESSPSETPQPVEAPDPAEASEGDSSSPLTSGPASRPRDADSVTAAAEESGVRPEPDATEPAAPRGGTGPAPVQVGGLSFGFNLGKIEGQGEDSDPILRRGRELGLVAVFDGMGGAGGTVYETPDGPRSGAYLASRVARDVVEERMVTLLDPEWDLDGDASAQDLRRSVRAALQARLAELKAPASGLRSRLLKALPTTMALVALQRREPGGEGWACHVLWAGDSRAYVFSPHAGAQQLTRDDIRDQGDAMANLREDSVVSNAMSADTDFVVHHQKVDVTAPFLVIAATDGCFGFVPSPMHFEHLVLAALRDAPDTASWSRAVQATISEVTGDDAAMAVLGVGADHETFQRLFAARTAELEQRWIGPLDALDADLRKRERELEQAKQARREQQARLWAAYKTDYERHLGPPTRQGTP